MADMSKINFNIDGVNNEFDIKDKVARNDIAINRLTLGVQCKNIFDIDAYQAILGTATRGTAEIVDNGIKITADKPDGTGKMGDAYTNPYLNHQNPYKIPVKPNTSYVFSWVADSNLQGFVYVFRNGLTSDSIGKNNQLLKSFSFTTNADTTFITVRFGVAAVNESITYTNIMIRPADITDDTYEPYKPSVTERLVEVEESVSELTPQVEQNKSDILIVNSLVVYCKNLIPQDVAIGYYADSTGAPTESTVLIRAVNYPKVKPNVKYTISSNLPIYSVWYFNGDTAISRESIKETTRTITIPENCNNIRISLQKPSSSSGTSEFKWLQVEEGEVATEFTPYVPSLQNQINALVERIAALETAQTQT